MKLIKLNKVYPAQYYKVQSVIAKLIKLNTVYQVKWSLSSLIKFIKLNKNLSSAIKLPSRIKLTSVYKVESALPSLSNCIKLILTLKWFMFENMCNFLALLRFYEIHSDHLDANMIHSSKTNGNPCMKMPSFIKTMKIQYVLKGN